MEGVDYHETFAPTANMTAVRTLMQIAADQNLIIHQIDVKTAYLNAEIDTDIYICNSQRAMKYKLKMEVN